VNAPVAKFSQCYRGRHTRHYEDETTIVARRREIFHIERYSSEDKARELAGVNIPAAPV